MSAFGSLFSSGYMGSTNGSFPGVFFDIYTGLLVAGLVASIYCYLRRRPLSRGVTPRRHLLRTVAQGGMYLFTIGLFLALMRYFQIPYLDMRILSYLLVLAAIGYAGYLTYYLSERYQLALYRFEHHEADRRYRVTAKRKPASGTSPSRSGMQRGKRRR